MKGFKFGNSPNRGKWLNVKKKKSILRLIYGNTEGKTLYPRRLSQKLLLPKTKKRNPTSSAI